MECILEAARLAPSSTNSQPWRIIVVTEPTLKANLAKATPAGINKHPWMADAPAIILLCSVKSGVQKIAQFFGKNYALVDMGIVGEHIVLTATELGLGTCWVGWFHKTKAKRLLGVPPAWELVCLIPLGYPKDEGRATGGTGGSSPPGGIQQRGGEPGIGNVAAKARRPIHEIVFTNKMQSLRDGVP